MERADEAIPSGAEKAVPPPAAPTQLAPPAPEAETLAPPPRPGSGPGDVPPLPAGVPPGLADHPRYRVIKLLGQGGMGAVYLAEHRHMERPVALKVVSADLVGNADAVRRFRQEVTAAARLGPHPHVVAVFDADQVGELHFLVMEYVDGQSLADYLHAKGPLPYAEACEYVRQAALGLQHAAEQGMVHRDVKPHNLMRTPQGQVKVLDFGLARCLRDSERVRTQLTQQGVLMGTADYMAPEQASDSRAADSRADVYSLGCTLYHLLTGRVPFPEGGTVEKIIQHAVEKPAPVGAIRPDLPVGVAQVVERMMAKLPEHRFQSPGEVAAALAPWTAAGASLPVRPVTVLAVPSGATEPLAGPPAVEVARLADAATIRRVRSAAAWLFVAGYLSGCLGGILFVVSLYLANRFPYTGSYTGPNAPFWTFDAFNRLAMASIFWGALSVPVLIGAAQMRYLHSLRWAQFGAICALIPVTPCLPFTALCGFRALACLSDPEVRAEFRRRAKV